MSVRHYYIQQGIVGVLSVDIALGLGYLLTWFVWSTLAVMEFETAIQIITIMFTLGFFFLAIVTVVVRIRLQGKNTLSGFLPDAIVLVSVGVVALLGIREGLASLSLLAPGALYAPDYFGPFVLEVMIVISLVSALSFVGILNRQCIQHFGFIDPKTKIKDDVLRRIQKERKPHN